MRLKQNPSRFDPRRATTRSDDGFDQRHQSAYKERLVSLLQRELADLDLLDRELSKPVLSRSERRYLR